MIRKGTVLIALALLVAACAPAAPPTPTSAPAKAAPTTAPAATSAAPAPTTAPTAVPAPKVDFPQKGKAITIVNPFAAGGASGNGARILAPTLEKLLGTPVEVVDKAGAGSQVGTTDVAQAKPDGYTLGMISIPTLNLLYLNPDRKTVFNRNSWTPIAGFVFDPGVIGVRADSPYKTLKDLVDAAKANPGKIRASTTGVLGAPHVAILQFEKMTGIQLAIVHFDGGAPAATALLGGHVDVVFGFNGDYQSYVKSGQIRMIATMTKGPAKYVPGVPTAESQGYNLFWQVNRVLLAPAGLPAGIQDVLSQGIKKAMDDPDLQKKMDAQSLEMSYLNPSDLSTLLDNTDAQIKPLMADALKDAAQATK